LLLSDSPSKSPKEITINMAIRYRSLATRPCQVPDHVMMLIDKKTGGNSRATTAYDKQLPQCLNRYLVDRHHDSSRRLRENFISPLLALHAAEKAKEIASI